MGGQFPDPDPALVERMDALLAAHGATRKRMFGTHSWFLDANGQMFASVWGSDAVVRVGEAEATRMASAGETQHFMPMPGRPPKKEYIVVPGDDTVEDDTLRPWLDRAAAFTAGLAPKKKK